MGVAFNYQITASQSPTGFNATGLPPGLTVNTGTGAISGTPTTNGIWSVTLSANNTAAAGTATLTLTVLLPFQSWQMQYFACINCPQAAPNADPYGKGMSNTNQFLVGLNPTNPASVFRVTSSVMTGNDFVLTWQTAGVRTNVVQAANGGADGSFNANFQDISGPIIIGVPGDTTTNYTDRGGGTNITSRFYRVRLGP